MINFSGISRSGFAGRLLRLPLRLVPKDAEVRILQGPLRGGRCIGASSNHGCWLGSTWDAAGPEAIKIDVEGAEAAVLRGAVNRLQERRPAVLVATHGERQRAECLDLLERYGYQVCGLDGGAPDGADELVAMPRAV